MTTNQTTYPVFRLSWYPDVKEEVRNAVSDFVILTKSGERQGSQRYIVGRVLNEELETLSDQYFFIELRKIRNPKIRKE